MPEEKIGWQGMIRTLQEGFQHGGRRARNLRLRDNRGDTRERSGDY